jgi:flagellar biosynthetic protein FliQ
MSEAAMVEALREGLWVSLQVMGPPMLALLVVGLAVSVVQALTQVQEATLSFVPKLVAGIGLMLLLGPLSAHVMRGWTEALFAKVVQVGGAP